jgi:hypothetical protein
MPPVVNYTTVSAVLAPSQVERLNRLRSAQEQVAPGRRISMSDVIREVLEAGLPICEEREGVTVGNGTA